VSPAADRPPGPPLVDVSALTRLLDGTHADVRNLVRRNLAEHASILTEAETLSRVRPIAVELVDAFGVPPEVLRAPDLVG